MPDGLIYCPRCLRVLCVCAPLPPNPRAARPWGGCGGEAREADGRRHPEPAGPPDPRRAA
jgi:hypothetical protein